MDMSARWTKSYNDNERKVLITPIIFLFLLLPLSLSCCCCTICPQYVNTYFCGYLTDIKAIPVLISNNDTPLRIVLLPKETMTKCEDQNLPYTVPLFNKL